MIGYNTHKHDEQPEVIGWVNEDQRALVHHPMTGFT